MKLALLSDTHGRADAARAALRLLDERAPDRFLHLGDVGAAKHGHAGVLDALAEVAAGRPVDLLPGNADADPSALHAAAASRGIECHLGLFRLTTGGVRAVGVHGHEPGGADLWTDGSFDLILHGHTHRRRDETKAVAGEPVRLINPGAAWRATPRSAAVLTLPAMTVEFLDVPQAGP